MTILGRCVCLPAAIQNRQMGFVSGSHDHRNCFEWQSDRSFPEDCRHFTVSHPRQDRTGIRRHSQRSPEMVHIPSRDSTIDSTTWWNWKDSKHRQNNSVCILMCTEQIVSRLRPFGRPPVAGRQRIISQLAGLPSALLTSNTCTLPMSSCRRLVYAVRAFRDPATNMTCLTPCANQKGCLVVACNDREADAKHQEISP